MKVDRPTGKETFDDDEMTEEAPFRADAVSRAAQMSYRRMVWRILSIAVRVYAGLCLFLFIFQRSFIYMPTPATAQHDAAISLEVPGARLRITTRPLDGPKALVYFGGNADKATPFQ